MRYQNWDVLVFPDECKVPLQEFKTNCQVIQDPEVHSMQLNPFLLPTVTCFIPGLLADSPFRISIHSWQNPEISRHIQGLRKSSDQVIFEARLFIDGRMAGSKYFNDDGPWPSVIELSLDLDKRGEFEKLRFPTFHKELLSQSYWNAGDDLGRIKVVISEGFARDNLTFPFERIKNVASFSFQHAPLDVLETSSIAWPNAAMWRQVSLLAPYYTQQTSPRLESDNQDAHVHSPRKAIMAARLPLQASKSAAPVHPANPPAFPPQTVHDPFTEPVRPSFKGYRQPSDTSMEGCSSANTRSNSSRHVTDPMVLCDKLDRRFETMQSAGAYASLCEALNKPSTTPSAPANTPQTAETGTGAISRSRVASISATIGSVPAKVESEQIVNSTAPLAGPVMNNVQSRKENLHSSPHTDLNQITSEGVFRKSSQTFAATNSGSKRQRVITPAASKVIDAEDEPRASPSSRKVSRASTTQENETERRALSGIQNV